MQTVLFLGNAGSPHLRHWSLFLQRAGIPHEVATIHAGNLMQGVAVRRLFPWVRRLGRAGDYVGYVLLGCWLRARYAGGRRGQVLLHAHNTSGYGLAALLSGCPYIVTTYGSEVYSAPARRGAYLWLIRAVLARAVLVTASSPGMAGFLRHHFGTSPDRIHAFSMSVDPQFFPDEAGRTRRRQALGIAADDLVWIYNRRIAPIYNTLAVVKAFQQYRAAGGSGHLLLLEGDCDAGYRDRVSAAIAAGQGVVLVPGFLGQAELRTWLSCADFSISVPDTDQMSSSILEAIACGCLPVVLNNEAYAEILISPLTTVVPDVSNGALLAAFRVGEGRRSQLGEAQRQSRALQVLGEAFGTEAVCEKVRAVYAHAREALR